MEHVGSLVGTSGGWACFARSKQPGLTCRVTPGTVSRRTALSLLAVLPLGLGALQGCSLLRPRTGIKLGIHVDEAGLYEGLAGAELQVGRRMDVVLLFGKVTEPTEGESSGPARAARLQSAGYEVALTLEFWDGGELHNPAFSLTSIAAGHHDEAYARWLRALRDLPEPIHLRPLHEFNGDWYPWCTFSPPNTIADLAPAWRHIASMARDLAGDKVILQLCYNRLSAHERPNPVVDFYPGDRYVDELVINGYNHRENPWESYAAIIGPFYRQLKAFRPHLPLWIGETASTEHGGDKATWITNMFRTVLTDQPVACLTWFDEYVTHPGEADRDWPFDSSPASLAAFRAGVHERAPDRSVP
jgi:hypothetical protein